MHDQLARIYHLALRILLTPLWRPPVAALAAAIAVRMVQKARGAPAAALAVLVGWLALVLPLNPFIPTGPVARLPGAALILLAFALAAGRAAKPASRLALPLYALAAAWWLRGAPVGGAAIATVIPVMLVLYAATVFVPRLAARDNGITTVAAATALAVSIALAGGAAHWSRAALVPAFAGLGLLGAAPAPAILAQAIVLVATAAVVAANRGRFLPVDLAASTPLLVYLLAPRLLPRLAHATPALAACLAAVGGIAAVWAATLLLAHR